jgi:GT2 family glycosyltransferase
MSMSEVSPPFISVVILNYQSLSFAESCVRSVLDSDYPRFELVIVDNASNPRVRMIRNKRNLGFARGNNLGYKNSKGEIVVFLNIDTVVERTWLGELVRPLISSSCVGGTQSKLTSLRERGQIDSLGPCMDHLGFIYARASQGPPSHADKEADLFYPDGSSMAFKRTVLDEVSLAEGPFDSDYFFYFEDNDLGWRVHLRGYRIIFVPSSVVRHYRGGSSSPAMRYLGTFSFARNRLATVVKNYELGNLFRFLPVIVLLEMGRIVLLLPREGTRSVAKLKGLLCFLADLKETWTKRQYVQAFIRAVPDSQVMRYMLRPNFSVLRKKTLDTPY